MAVPLDGPGWPIMIFVLVRQRRRWQLIEQQYGNTQCTTQTELISTIGAVTDTRWVLSKLTSNAGHESE
jgi:hypothetical protein